MFRNHRNFITRNEKDTSNNPPPGTGSGGSPGRPINEDIEKRSDPSKDYKNYKDGSHERLSPTISEENYYFGDD